MTKLRMQVAQADIKTQGWFWYLMADDKIQAMNGPYFNKPEAQAAATELMQATGCDIYLEVEQHPSGWWFNVIDDNGFTDDEQATTLVMDGPFKTEQECNDNGEQALRREIQSAN